MHFFLGAATLAVGVLGWRALRRWQRRKAISAALRRSVAMLEALEPPPCRGYRLMGY